MYSPKIKEDLIPKLYKLAQRRKEPMTKLVDRIIRENIAKYGIKKPAK